MGAFGESQQTKRQLRPPFPNRKRESKSITIEELAAASQREFRTIRSEMTTKEDLRNSETNILRAIEGIDLKISSYASRWTEDFSKLHDWMQELDTRVKSLEKAKR